VTAATLRTARMLTSRSFAGTALVPLAHPLFKRWQQEHEGRFCWLRGHSWHRACPARLLVVQVAHPHRVHPSCAWVHPSCAWVRPSCAWVPHGKGTPWPGARVRARTAESGVEFGAPLHSEATKKLLGQRLETKLAWGRYQPPTFTACPSTPNIRPCPLWKKAERTSNSHAT